MDGATGSGRLETSEAGAARQNEIAMLAARMNRLPATAITWKFVVLISLGGFFEFFELFSTAYIMPGIVRSGLLKQTTETFFSLGSMASYIAATFSGLFIGTFVFGFVADKLGRRAVFTYSLLWYSACAIGTACQTDALGLSLWRLLTGIGLGVELVTIDVYLSELVPPQVRGRAFALSQVITYLAVPTVALLSWLLVPQQPWGIEGWRLVMVIGATGAVAVWVIRLGLPESPRWLASHGNIKLATAIVDRLERQACRESGRELDVPTPQVVSTGRGSFAELWNGKFATRTVMLLVFHATQSIGLYGFATWVPTFLIHQGVELTRSLEYSVIIALVTPTGPLIAMLFADRIERKWQIVGASILVATAGLVFAEVRSGAAVILCGALVTLGATIISLSFHAYQSELYPTRIRALAVGFVYSASRVSGIFSGFLISFTLANGGISAVLMLVAGCMGVVVLSVGLLGPRTRGQSLEALSGDGEAASSSVLSSPTPSPTLATAQPQQWSRS